MPKVPNTNVLKFFTNNKLLTVMWAVILGMLFIMLGLMDRISTLEHKVKQAQGEMHELGGLKGLDNRIDEMDETISRNKFSLKALDEKIKILNSRIPMRWNGDNR